MDKTIETIEQYNRMFGVETKHPLVTVVEVKDYAPAADELIQTVKYGLYAIFLKQGVGCRLRYGRKEYDYQAGSIVAMAPGQVVTTEFIEGEHSSWKALLSISPTNWDMPSTNTPRSYSRFMCSWFWTIACASMTASSSLATRLTHHSSADLKGWLTIICQATGCC